MIKGLYSRQIHSKFGVAGQHVRNDTDAVRCGRAQQNQRQSQRNHKTLHGFGASANRLPLVLSPSSYARLAQMNASSGLDSPSQPITCCSISHTGLYVSDRARAARMESWLAATSSHSRAAEMSRNFCKASKPRRSNFSMRSSLSGVMTIVGTPPGVGSATE